LKISIGFLHLHYLGSGEEFAADLQEMADRVNT
jgi:hypothetical protein